MDIISAHQLGLIEQIEADASALAGRPCDHGQRAVMLHHLYDHSRGSHAWAVLEARRELRIAEGIAKLRRSIGRWGWTSSRRERADAAVGQLAHAIGETGRARSFAAYSAYRLSATPALRAEAEQRLPADMLAGLDRCHLARRSGEEVPIEVREALVTAVELAAAAAVDQSHLASAWSAIDATGLRRSARRLLGEKALLRASCRDSKRGWDVIERDFLSNRALPPSFRANPAQHFYALQHSLAERRRQQWREACDREPDAFELAA